MLYNILKFLKQAYKNKINNNNYKLYNYRYIKLFIILNLFFFIKIIYFDRIIKYKRFYKNILQ